MRNVTIIGRRWFQRTYGNTYHTAQVIIDGREVGTTAPQYGYGDQYIYSGFDLMTAQGLDTPARHTNGGREATWTWARREGIELLCQAIDVARERDL